MMYNKRVALVLGIRPDVIRASKIIKLLDESGEVELKFIWSGQHYSDNMKDVFFRELKVRSPDIELKASGNNDAELVGKIITVLYTALGSIKPAISLFLGDTNTVAGCLSAAQLNIPIFHIEGCMRSFDWTMPEEKYRTMIDHLSDVVYAYLPVYRDNGILEGLCPRRIIVTGNPIVDVLQEYFIDKKKVNIKKEILNKYQVNESDYAIMTCHRRENIDNGVALQNVISLSKHANREVLFFAGYRTQRRLKENAISLPNNVRMYDPVGYNDLLYLMDSSRFVISDSGTVIEEACILGVPSIQIRFSTERPEVYEVGSSVRFNPREEISENSIFNITIEKVVHLKKNSWDNPFGDGKASERIAEDIIKRLHEGEISTSTHYFDFSRYNIARAIMG